MLPICRSENLFPCLATVARGHFVSAHERTEGGSIQNDSLRSVVCGSVTHSLRSLGPPSAIYACRLRFYHTAPSSHFDLAWRRRRNRFSDRQFYSCYGM